MLRCHKAWFLAVVSWIQASSAQPSPSLAIWGADGSGADLPRGVLLTKTAQSFDHSLGITPGGEVFTWGAMPQQPPPEATNVIDVAAGRDFSGALRADGTVVYWGNPGFWGSQSYTSDLIANRRYLAEPSKCLSAMYYKLLSVGANGWACRWDQNGVSRISGFYPSTAIAAGKYHCLGLNSNGTVAIYSDAGYTDLSPPPGLDNVVAVAAGEEHCVALKSNGMVVAWGGLGGQRAGVTNVPPDLTNSVAIAAGGDWSMALTSEDRLVAWGGLPADPETHESLAVPQGLKNLTWFKVGPFQATGVTTNPAPCISLQPRGRSVPKGFPVTLKAWASGHPPLQYQWQFNGADIVGATNNTLTLTNNESRSGSYQVMVSNAFGGATSRVAQLALGVVLAWGKNNAGQCLTPSSLSNAVSIAAGSDQSVALTADGRVVSWGGLDTRQVPGLESARGAVSIAARGNSGLGIMPDGSVRVWSKLPAHNVPVLTNAVSADFDEDGNGFAVLSDGTVRSWNWAGIGTGYTGLQKITNAVAIKGGPGYAVVLHSTGQVSAWPGRQIPLPASSLPKNVVQVATGAGIAYGLTSEGNVCDLKTAQIVPFGSNIVSIAADGYRWIGLKADGTVTGGGTNWNNGYGLAAALSNVVEVAAGFDHNIVRFGDGSPRITVNPYNRPMAAGSNAVLTTFAVGQQPMLYQWQRNGSDMPWQTNASLVLSGADTATAGDYRCVVTNPLGSTTGSVATVSVVFPPLKLVPGASLADGGLKFSVQNLSGQGEVVVYASTNLIDWESILTNTSGATTLEVNDPAAKGASVRFYKASEERSQ